MPSGCNLYSLLRGGGALWNIDQHPSEQHSSKSSSELIAPYIPPTTALTNAGFNKTAAPTNTGRLATIITPHTKHDPMKAPFKILQKIQQPILGQTG